MHRPIPLAPYATALYARQDGASLAVAIDLPSLAAGEYVWQGIPFTIGGVHEQACVAVAKWSSRKTSLPEQADIPVGIPCRRLFFIHTLSWAGKLPSPHARTAIYRIEFEDRTSLDVPVRNGREITDHYVPVDCPAAMIVWRHVGVQGNPNAHLGIALFEWENPRPSVSVRSIRMIAEPHDRVTTVLIALTASDSSESLKSRIEQRGFDQINAPLARRPAAFPKAGEYQVLLGDFHTHTCTDGCEGNHTPEGKAREAWADGLDVLAITDHYTVNAYPAARPEAERLELLLIPGEEIPVEDSAFVGHVISLGPARAMKGPSLNGLLRAIRSADGLTILAHPYYEKGDERCAAAVAALAAGLFDGVELHSASTCRSHAHGATTLAGATYFERAWEWHKQYGLTLFACSDSHYYTAWEPSAERARTIIFAAEKTWPAVRDALRQGRTLAWFDGAVWGDRQWLDALWETSVEWPSTCALLVRENRRLTEMSVTNKSQFPFEVQIACPDGAARAASHTIRLLAGSATRIPCVICESDARRRRFSLVLEVVNLREGPSAPYRREVQIEIAQ